MNAVFKNGFFAFIFLTELWTASTAEGQSGNGGLLDNLLSRKERSIRKSRLSTPSSTDDYEVLAEFTWNDNKIKELSHTALGQLEKFIRQLQREKTSIEDGSGEQRSSRHVKRGLRLPNEHRPRWTYQRVECRRANGIRKCRVRKCGFQAPLDRISYNPNFGCKQRPHSQRNQRQL